MSLINDALQRAKQQTTTQAAGNLNLPLRPADAQAQPHSSKGMLFTLGFVALLVAAGAIVPRLVNHQAVSPVPAAALKTIPAPEPATERVAMSRSIASPSAAQATQAPVPAEPAPESVNPARPEAVAAAPVEEAPAAPTFKLNGIFFTARKPSAIINGRTVYPNSRIGDFRVQAITATHVRLASATQTNVLSFNE